jgi:hypothetical protein
VLGVDACKAGWVGITLSQGAVSAYAAAGIGELVEAGATDLEIQDTVLIAAAFCMFNRYVDGLATIAPDDAASYEVRAQRIVADGYLGLLAASQAQGRRRQHGIRWAARLGKLGGPVA